MTRSEQDTWDLASSVGATATMVAAARAVASAEPNPIINDPFAAPLVRAVGLDFFTRVVDGEVTASDAGKTANGTCNWRPIRSRYAPASSTNSFSAPAATAFGNR